MQPKNYLEFERNRNRANALVFTDIIKRALGGEYAVLVGHHFAFQCAGNLETENEIPSADTLLFDHEIMTAVFGDDAVRIMTNLAAMPCEQRDAWIANYMDGHP